MRWASNKICRRRAGLEVASDIELRNVWVQSKRQPMDELSRNRVVHPWPADAAPGARLLELTPTQFPRRKL